VFASAAVAVNVAMIFGVLSLLGATLTLPASSGIVLTIGIGGRQQRAHLRAHPRRGCARRSPIAAIDAGSRGRLRPSSTPTSRPSSRPPCCSHWHRPASAVRGDARIGIITDLHCITLTRLMVAWWVRWVRPQQLRSLRPARALAFLTDVAYRPDDTKFDFMRFRPSAFRPRRALDRGDLPLLLRRLELWHRLSSRHAARSQDKVGAPADLANMRTDLGALGLGDIQLQSSAVLTGC